MNQHYAEDGKTKNYTFLTDMTLLKSVEENGITNKEMWDNLKIILDNKTHQYMSIAPRRTPSERNMKRRAFELPVEFHDDTIEVYGWLRKTMGGGMVLNIALSEAILDMRKQGMVSFNEYCQQLAKEIGAEKHE